MADSVSFSIDVGVQAAGADSAAASVDNVTDKLLGLGDAAPQVTREWIQAEIAADWTTSYLRPLAWGTSVPPPPGHRAR